MPMRVLRQCRRLALYLEFIVRPIAIPYILIYIVLSCGK